MLLASFVSSPPPQHLCAHVESFLFQHFLQFRRSDQQFPVVIFPWCHFRSFADMGSRSDGKHRLFISPLVPRKSKKLNPSANHPAMQFQTEPTIELPL